MNISMAGIDFGSAAIRQREAFAFTKTQAAQAMHSAVQILGMKGCVIYSTCNRTEIWLCSEKCGQADPAEILCSLRGLPQDRFSGVIVVRNGEKAVRHLFETACGLHSRIWGEDQIITQIKDAIGLSMAEGTAGKVLGKLFQSAVTSAKKIKTQVRFSSGGSSVAAATVEKCKELCGGVDGRRCLVIGNGEMGRHTVQELIAAGAQVFMTLRQYKYGISVIPENCKSIAYNDRIAGIKDVDIIISATSSPHYTLHYDQVADACAANPKNRIFIDLAVPRDIDPQIAELPNSKLLTIDDIPCRIREEERSLAEAQCNEIIAHYIKEFEKQLTAWFSLAAIQSLAGNFESSLGKELATGLKQMNVSSEQQETIMELTQNLAKENACKMLFAFRDWMEENAGGRGAPLSDSAKAMQ